jgi:hypothetical protein
MIDVPEPVTAPVIVPVPAPAPPPVVLPHRARTAGEQGENLGKIVLYHQVESPQNPAIVTPAIVQAVRDAATGAVRLCVFGHGGIELVDDVLPGFAVGQWSLQGAAPPPPVVTALEPATAVVGAPSFTLHVRGTGFGPGSVIVFAGQDEPTTVVSDTEITTGVNMAVWTAPDPAVPVLVRAADGVESAAQTFAFTAAAGRAGARTPTPEPEPEPDPPTRHRR